MYPFSLAACVKRKRGFHEVNSQPGARRKQLLRDKTSRGQERRSTKRRIGRRMKAPSEISFLYRSRDFNDYGNFNNENHIDASGGCATFMMGNFLISGVNELVSSLKLKNIRVKI